VNVELVEFGADPEFFIVRTKGSDNAPEIMSADKFLPSKRNKYRGCSGDIFFDGVQAEINPRHNTCREEFAMNIDDCLIDVLSLIDKKRSVNQELSGKYNLWALPAVNITKETIKGTDSECKRFGCSPDINIYEDEKKIKYPNGNYHLIRYAGGHIHLGHHTMRGMEYFAKPDNIKRLVKSLDIFVGTFTTAIIKDNEGEKIRRKYYGRAGTFRINEHGIEYRVPSSFWISSPILVSLILSLARDAYTATIHELDKKSILKDVDTNLVRDIINNSDRGKARTFYNEILTKYYDYLKEKVDCKSDLYYYSPLSSPDDREAVYALLNSGYEYYFNPKRIFQNWSININDEDFGRNNLDMEYGFHSWAEEFYY